MEEEIPLLSGTVADSSSRKRAKHGGWRVPCSPTTRFKGVVLQQNGHWGRLKSSATTMEEESALVSSTATAAPLPPLEPPRKWAKPGGCRVPSSSATKFKGVVLQQNGHWGAQIYTNHQRVWLGTFKSAEEAAAAYDSAALRLRPADPHRNFPSPRASDSGRYY